MKIKSTGQTIREIAWAAAVSAVIFLPIGCASQTATTTATTGTQTGEMVNPDGSVTTSTTVTTVSAKATDVPDWNAHEPSAKSNTNPANDTGKIVNKDDGGVIGVDHLSSDFANNTKGDTALHEKGNIPPSSNVKVSSNTTYSTTGGPISTADVSSSSTSTTSTLDTTAPAWNAQNPPLSTSASVTSGTVINKDDGGVVGVDHMSSDFANNTKGDTANSSSSTYSSTSSSSQTASLGSSTTKTTTHRSVRGMHHRREKKE